MRGAHCGCVDAHSYARIIPAYAGSTKRRSAPILSGRDHPRVCGEHVVVGRSMRSARGSSPRMRGARLLSVRRAICCGIIPAYAGSTLPRSGRSGRRGDHPRVCGEHVEVFSEAVAEAGSSPRMRGAQGREDLHRAASGIIPAYAGSTRRS